MTQVLAPGVAAGDPLAPLERLLFACLGGTETEAASGQLRQLSEEEWASLVRLADDQKVGPTLRRRLLSPACASSLPAQIREAMATRQRRTAVVNMRIHSDFGQVVTALHEGGISVIALKGLHLLSLVYGDVASRAVGDIDLLVPSRDLARAGTVLQDRGFHPLSPYRVSRDPVPYASHHLPRFAKPGTTDVEIHWHVVPPHGASHGVSFDVDELWQRSVAARVAGVDVRVLAPEDLLLHLCVHATCSHLCEFAARPWCDIARTIARHGESLSWEDVTTRATRWRCRRGTYLALHLSRDLVGAAVPARVLEALRPPNFDEQVLALATRQRQRSHMSPALAQLAGQRSAAGSLRTLWSGLFVPRDVVADAYNLPRSSRVVYAYYLVRLVHLARRYGRSVVRLQRRDPALTVRAAETMALSRFLAEE